MRLVAELQDTRSGDHVPIVVETAPGQDIDARGIYRLTLHVGDERWTFDARVALVPGRRGRSRRRRRALARTK